MKYLLLFGVKSGDVEGAVVPDVEIETVDSAASVLDWTGRLVAGLRNSVLDGIAAVDGSNWKNIYTVYGYSSLKLISTLLIPISLSLGLADYAGLKRVDTFIVRRLDSRYTMKSSELKLITTMSK